MHAKRSIQIPSLTKKHTKKHDISEISHVYVYRTYFLDRITAVVLLITYQVQHMTSMSASDGGTATARGTPPCRQRLFFSW